MGKLGIRINDLLEDFLNRTLLAPMRKLGTKGNANTLDLVTKITFPGQSLALDRITLQLGNLLGFGNLGGRTEVLGDGVADGHHFPFEVVQVLGDDLPDGFLIIGSLEGRQFTQSFQPLAAVDSILIVPETGKGHG